MHAALYGWPGLHNLFCMRAKTRLLVQITGLGQGEDFSGRLRLWFLQLLVPAECVLWRFSSHSEHSNLLLAADLLTGYDSS